MRSARLGLAKGWPARGSLPRVLRRLTPNSFGQAGDGRERALARHVLATTPSGDLDAVIAAIDEFAYQKAHLINVGDEKGAILDAAVRSAEPRRLLELGTYCGYSALRIARVMPPGARLVSIERGAANARIASRILRHAGVAQRVGVVVGRLDDGGATLARLRERHGFAPGALDFAFLDHGKEEYLPDLERILAQGWLRPGSIVVADNIENPGVPDYLRYMRRHQGTLWRTTEHHTHVEYQHQLPDLVLESEYLGIRPD
ncbi:O-methyltransferase [Pseudonocardia acaciae]|uniref:O-methyltransferase n=1 Tax=Pseudonocardia acaciae TaxID=551276 RepID=UPI000560F117|nr:class I SAM-dependent methyltransferase [Pseudonocardia acaciae]